MAAPQRLHPLENGLLQILLNSSLLSIWNCSMRDMIYPSPAIPVGEPAPGMEEVVITSGDGSTLVGWYKPLAGVTLKRPAILFLHGNGENLETLRATATLAHLDVLPSLDIYPNCLLNGRRWRGGH